MMESKIPFTSLTEQYKLLKEKTLRTADDELCHAVTYQEMDAIFTRIVSTPVVDVVTAVEKLKFAYHCLTEEEDFKEGASLVLQVYQALDRFREKQSCFLRSVVEKHKLRRSFRTLRKAADRSSAVTAR